MKDVADVINSGIEHKTDVEVLATELNGIRLTYSANASQCISYAIPLILGEIKKLEGKKIEEIVKNIQKVLKDWERFIKFFSKEENEQIVLIQEIEVIIVFIYISNRYYRNFVNMKYNFKMDSIFLCK